MVLGVLLRYHGIIMPFPDRLSAVRQSDPLLFHTAQIDRELTIQLTLALICLTFGLLVLVFY
jgi:hypothetical protein